MASQLSQLSVGAQAGNDGTEQLTEQRLEERSSANPPWLLPRTRSPQGYLELSSEGENKPRHHRVTVSPLWGAGVTPRRTSTWPTPQGVTPGSGQGA